MPPPAWRCCSGGVHGSCHLLPALRLTEPAAISPLSSDSLEKDGSPPVICPNLSGDAGNGIRARSRLFFMGGGSAIRGVPEPQSHEGHKMYLSYSTLTNFESSDQPPPLPGRRRVVRRVA